MIKPKLRAILFLIFINCAWIFASWLWTDRDQWMWITPIALSINFLLLTYDQVLSFKGLESTKLEGQDPYGLLKTVHALCERFQIAVPNVFLIPHPSAQAFAYARTSRSSRLFVSEGTLKLLTKPELEAVLTFQLFAIKNSLSVLNYWAGALLDLVYRLGLTLEKAVAFVLGWTPKISVWLIRPLMWMLQVVLMSPRDFQRLDGQVAARLGHAEDLARALWKMDSYAQTLPFPDAWVFAHMCIVSPLDGTLILNSVHVQPPLKRRIKHLTGRYPL